MEAPPTSKQIVDAGPGTGKTATLCARTAWLIQSPGLEPAEIWIISFTRTAVAEIRNRVSSYLSDPVVAQGIRVATIDSHAWAMNLGFTDVPVLSGDFDDNIKHVIEVVRSNEHAAEYISSVNHLFIDEAQDVIGPRVEFVLELMHALPSSAGATVLCDDAQAIYEYSEDDKNEVLSGTDMVRAAHRVRARGVVGRRDMAMFYMLFATGARPLETARLVVADYLEADGQVRRCSTLRADAAIGARPRPLYFASDKLIS